MTKEEETRHGILRDRFFLKMFFGFSILLLLVNTVILVFSLRAIKNFNITNLRRNLLMIAEAIESNVEEFIGNRELKKLDNWVKDKSKILELRITVIDDSGKVLADSEKNPEKMENHANRPEVSEALKGKKGYSIRYSNTVKEHMLYLAYPSVGSSGVKSVIRTSLYLKDITVFINNLKKNILKIVLISFLISLFFSWYITKKFHSPLKEIITSTEKLSSGDFTTRLYFQKRSGLKYVSESFNSMVLNQQELFDDLEEKKSELTAIISSMEESLIVIDTRGKIQHANESFINNFSVKDPTGKYYWEIIRFPELENLFKKNLNISGRSVLELNVKNRYILVSINNIKNTGKKIMTLKDITEYKNLETMKREFILNLTHEFKTPLTAIKGFVETLNEEEDIKNKKYIDIIYRHTDRMTQLVSDLLTLSELEEGVKNLKFEKLSISEILKNVIRIFKEKIENKGLKLIVSIDKKTPDIMGEKFKLEQMFINLIDNAMKYTDKGTIEIEMKYSIEKNEILFNISNSGSLIPEESIPRIFERFYVVDKSRSKKVGGTGLGLSIVKHVVLIHKGEISVRNRKSAGTQFLIKFPV